MKRYYVAVAVLLLGVSAFVFVGKIQRTADMKPPSGGEGSLKSEPHVTQMLTNDGKALVAKASGHTNAATLSQKYIKALHDVAVADNGELRFYCRIIDQTGTSVAGAHVKIRYSRSDENWILHPRGNGPRSIQSTNELISDAEGRCSIVGGTARFFYVMGIEKEGYIYRSVGQTEFFEYTHDAITRSKAKLPDYMNPKVGAVFRTWKMAGETSHLVPVQSFAWLRSGVSDYEMPLLGSASSLKIMIRTSRIYPEDATKQFDRYITVEVPGGEIQQAVGTYPYLAPTDGYSNQWVRAFEPSKGNAEGWNLPYYLRARNGKIFGAVNIDFLTRANGFTITGFLNLNGSPNLEPDPEKLITDPDEIRRLDEATRAK